ncbi:dermonecrotic toxin domain-containing protein [Dyella flava]|uniref:Dermonecrotic toxin N-terminal domain-containing protein n=1 Tax=Dyella flava TaxID=1920170 RepID=A0ABS2K6M1_9GAMM|nr:DUF6543 domain-containing protein [Dyella flava]MBM7126832.1 hypothetical protein [Dyella flava]GLQ50409.1 hypothetical protein GCM10010872_18580 [Dyella flava]
MNITNNTLSPMHYGGDTPNSDFPAPHASSKFDSAPKAPAVAHNPTPFNPAPIRKNAATHSTSKATPKTGESGRAVNQREMDSAVSQDLSSRTERLSRDERSLAANIPNYHAEASAYMKQFIKDHFGKDIDPDQVYLNEYDPVYENVPSLAGSKFPPVKREVSAGALVASTPLSQIAYANQSANIAPDIKRFHITASNDPHQTWAGQKDLIEPHDFYKSLSDLDFKAYYAGKIDRFYKEHGGDMRRVAQERAVLELDAQHSLGQLNDKDYALAKRAFVPDPHDRNPPKVYPFEIGGYQSNDGLMIIGEDRVMVYLRGEDTPLKCFNNQQAVQAWLEALGARREDLRIFANKHFSSNEADGRTGGPGVIGELDPDSSYAFKNTHQDMRVDLEDIRADPFGHLVEVSHRHDKEDADFDITSNADVNEKKVMALMDDLPIPVAPGILELVLGKTKSQKLDGVISLGTDMVSEGAAKVHPHLSYVSDSAIPLAEGKGESDPAPGPDARSRPVDHDDPDSPGKVKYGMQVYGTNNWNKSW